MVSMTLALLTVLPARNAIVVGAKALLAAPAKGVAAADTPASPIPVLALPAPKGPSPLLAAIEGHRSANLAMSQAVRDYVEAEATGAPDERHLLAAADRAGDVEAKAFNALMALAPADAEEARTLTAYLAEVSADFDRDGFGTLVLRRLAIMLANAKEA